MKLKFVRLLEKGMQVCNGRLPQSLTSEHFEMVLLSNLRTIKIGNREWPEPIYVPVERVDNFSPHADLK